MPALAKRLSRIKPSATVAIAQKARELQAKGKDVLSFSVGEPDFDTPKHVCEAGKAAIDAGATRYTAAGGTVELRAAICKRSEARRDTFYKPASVVVSVGAKHSLFNLAVVLYDPRDEVIIPAPYWVSYPEQVRMMGAEPVIVETREEDGFRVTPEALKAALTPSTKAIILCTPSNPTGSAYSPAELEALAAVLRDHHCWIIVDEIYAELVYGDFEQKSIVTIAPDLKDRIIIVDGVSKTYAMTGWRIGWILGPEEVANACNKIQGQSTTNPTANAQDAAIAALEGPQDCVSEMRAAFEKRRGLIVDGLNALPGVSCPMPEGAFYAFANVSELVGRKGPKGPLADDLAVADYFLDEALCAFVPGSAFGAPGYLRISYACSEKQIRDGLSRMREAIAKLG